MSGAAEPSTPVKLSVGVTHRSSDLPEAVDELLDDALAFFESAPAVICPPTAPRRPAPPRRNSPLPSTPVLFAPQPDFGTPSKVAVAESRGRPEVTAVVALPAPHELEPTTIAMLPRKILLCIFRFLDPDTLIKVAPSVCRRFRWATIERAKELKRLQTEFLAGLKAKLPATPIRPPPVRNSGADEPAGAFPGSPLVERYLSTATELGSPMVKEQRAGPHVETLPALSTHGGGRTPVSLVMTFVLSFFMTLVILLSVLGTPPREFERDSSVGSLLATPVTVAAVVALSLEFLDEDAQNSARVLLILGVVSTWAYSQRDALLAAVTSSIDNLLNQ